ADSARQPLGVRHNDAPGTVLTYAPVSSDAVGNPVNEITHDGMHTMTYDAANQLLSEYDPIAGVKTCTFDLAGNRLSQDFTQVNVRSLTNWSCDAADQLVTEITGASATTFTFDNTGNEQAVATP